MRGDEKRISNRRTTRKRAYAPGGVVCLVPFRSIVLQKQASGVRTEGGDSNLDKSIRVELESNERKLVRKIRFNAWGSPLWMPLSKCSRGVCAHSLRNSKWVRLGPTGGPLFREAGWHAVSGSSGKNRELSKTKHCRAGEIEGPQGLMSNWKKVKGLRPKRQPNIRRENLIRWLEL